MAQRVGKTPSRKPLLRGAAAGLPAALASSVLRAWSRARLPSRSGTLRASGLASPVEVGFDEHAVPHVRASSDADAFLAVGVCHGLERFFQMDMTRRVLAGRLAETTGERGLGPAALPPFAPKQTTTDLDRLMRGLDLVRAAERYLATARPEHLVLLDAYVAGVNAARRLLSRRRPPEYRLLRLPLEPWRALDSVLLGKGLALALSFKWRAAPVFGAVAEALASRPDRLDAILPEIPGRGATAVASAVRRGIGAALEFLPFGTPAVGSNAFLVGGGRSRSGKPVLASDPHLELSLPGIWYLASVRGDTYAAVGCTLPGLPGVLIGRTPSVAWGVTNGMIDDADLWQERVEPVGDRYLLDGAWRPLEVETQEILRRGRSPLLFRMRRTHRGPLVSDAFPGYQGPPLSLRLALHDPGHEMETFLGLGRARTGADVRAAAVGYGSPCQNLLYADDRGDAGYLLLGRVPRRSFPHHPALPRDGSTTAHDWTGYLPPEDLPALRVGPEGELVSANHQPVSGDYPHYLSHLYEPDYRARRIGHLLRGRRGLRAEDLWRLQEDARDLAVEGFRKGVLVPHAEAVRRTRPHLARHVDLLLAWDGEESVGARGAALWHFTYNHLVRRTFGAGLPTPLLERWMSLVNLVDPILLAAFEDPASPWAPPAIRATLLGEAVEDAVASLAERGLAPDAPWGAVHTLRLRHPLGNVPWLAPAVNRGPFPVPGGPYAVCSGQYFHDRPADVVAGASYRQVVDLGDPEGASRMVTFGGQSGWCGSPHYDDLTPLWRAGTGVPMRLAEIPAGGSRLRLVPDRRVPARPAPATG